MYQGSFSWVRDRAEGLESMLRPELFFFLGWLITKGVMKHVHEELHKVSHGRRGRECSGPLQGHSPLTAPHSPESRAMWRHSRILDPRDPVSIS